MHIDDVIYAPASGSGGAIGIVRISGQGCLELADRIVKLRRGTIASATGFSLRFGLITDLDEVLVSIFKAPRSYTGEDMVELSCHASQYVLAELMQRLSDAGARLAEPGEFTRRAFLNGKMDLAQAEAVADIISSSSSAQHRVALNQLRGGFSAELEGIRAQLLELTSLLELELDFSEEDLEFADRNHLKELTESAIDRCSSLADSFKVGNAVRNGVPVAIIGPPNSGKSTLLNALLKDDRAIVSDIPGTTRDTVEETCVIDGILFRFIDTAGIRSASDEIERLGIERTYRKAAEAEMILGLLDLSECRSEAEFSEAVKELARVPDFSSQKLIIIANKADIAPCNKNVISYNFSVSRAEFKDYSIDYLMLSAKNGQGLDELRNLLVSKSGLAAATGTLVTNARHAQALRSTADSLARVREGMELGLPSDLLAEDLRAALDSLGSITGHISNEETLGLIFSRFCVGK